MLVVENGLFGSWSRMDRLMLYSLAYFQYDFEEDYSYIISLAERACSEGSYSGFSDMIDP